MNPIRVHPVTAGLALIGVVLLSVARGQQPQQVRLTPEQREILGHMSIVYLDDGQGGQAKTIRFTGVTVQVVNGLGATNGRPDAPYALQDPVTNGLGNVIIGYDEAPATFSTWAKEASHMLVMGIGNHYRYEAVGGIIGGYENYVGSVLANVIGGAHNGTDPNIFGDSYLQALLGGEWNSSNAAFGTCVGGQGAGAGAAHATAIGGVSCQATGVHATVVGGSFNLAEGDASTICGGSENRVIPGGENGTVLGGNGGRAEAPYSTSLAGVSPSAQGAFSIAIGGRGIVAVGDESVALGGEENVAGGTNSVVMGGYRNITATLAYGSACLGGYENTVSGTWAGVAGGRFNDAAGWYSTVSGGAFRLAQGEDDWVAGSLNEDN